LKRSLETVPVGFALLYPPYMWIPAQVGMPEEVSA
jgi:hypothetical protein